MVLSTSRPVLLVGGAPVDAGDLAALSGRYHRIVAADGGADQLAGHGLRPDAIIGDLDSLRAPAGWGDVPVHRIAEQDSTDFDKCLAYVDAPLFFAVGFSGGRLDHVLAAFSTVAQSGARVVLLGDGDLCCRLNESIRLKLLPGTRVSLFPMGAAQGVSSTGLRWPVDGLDMAPAGRIGTSNEATGPVEIAMQGGPVLLILPRDCLNELLEEMEASDV